MSKVKRDDPKRSTASESRFTLFEFEREFPDDSACLEYLVARMYPDGIACRKCGKVTKHHKINGHPIYKCQFCGRSITELRPRESLTRDHLVPLSRGGTNIWTNVVTACSPCNTRKGNRLPSEIGMHPLTNPIEPHFVHLSWAVRRLTPIQARYIRMFYGAGVLHQLEGLEHRRPRVRGA